MDGAAGRLNASQAGVTRVRTALEGSRGFTVGGRVSLTPSVEVGLRQDGGDAETGTGMDVGGGLVFTDSVTGLSLDVRMRTLVVHQAEGFTERGHVAVVRLGPDAVEPAGADGAGGPVVGRVRPTGGADALWRSQTAYGMGSHQMAGSGGQVNAEVGYGLPVQVASSERRASASRRLSTGATTGSATGWGCWSGADWTSASTCRARAGRAS